jgi:regulator of protease activity HflC (stomatin/prohibitin superfamily)
MYWRGGALLSETTQPGFHSKVPFVTTWEPVQITLQTDVVKDIPCGTSNGVMVTFDKIEVVNILNAAKAHATVKRYGVSYDKIWIFDRIHHEINQFCSSHTLQQVYIDMFEVLDEALAAALQKNCDEWDTGIQIVGIRVTKPRIPESVRANYENIEKQKSHLLVQIEAEKTARKEEEIARMRETMKAQKEAEVGRINAQRDSDVARTNAERVALVAKIEAEKELLQKEAEQKRKLIDDAIYLNQKKTRSDAEHYELVRRAEGQKELYTDAYLRYVLYSSLANNTKIFFGEKIPTMWLPFLEPEAMGKPV